MIINFSPWLIWFLTGIAIMLAELAVPGFVIIFFGLGCLGAAVVAAIAPDAYTAQLIAFLIVSLTSLVTLRKIAMRIFVGRSEVSENNETGNVSVGTRIKIDQDIEPGQEARVRYRGTMWTAISEERIPAGSEAEIVGVDKANRSCLKLRIAHHL
ncbi:NfeD family protein [uncultured Desulfobulbus sp.]|uniref:NfeD family protein n=1 Tax=uncultured Desulfobulbus sp. TaxID=239745 RepID=UPI0029C6EFBA|nr:NfeD family protein [uncultured Desulfobulbus sp.]